MMLSNRCSIVHRIYRSSCIASKTRLTNHVHWNSTNYITHKFFSSSSKGATGSTTSSSLSGQDYYKLSLEYHAKYIKQQHQVKEKNSFDQYESMMEMAKISTTDKETEKKETKKIQQQQQQQQQNRRANVAIVRTIAKQTRESNIDKFSKSSNNTNNTSNSIDYEKEARKYLQYAAFLHGHPQALVQIANQALELSSSNEKQDLYSFIDTSITATTDTSSNTTIINNSTTDTMINMHELTNNTSNHIDMAKFLYQKAIDYGKNNAAMYNLAHLLWTESNDIITINNNNLNDTNKSDHDLFVKTRLNSIRLFHEAAMDLHDMDALYFLGVQYLTLFGTFVSAEDNGGDNNNKISNNNEEILSTLILQTIMEENNSNIQTTNELRHLGFTMIKQASELHHSGASYYLALMYRNGDDELDIQPCIFQFQHFLNAACGDYDETTENNGNNESTTTSVDADALYLRAHCLFHKEDGYGNNDNHYLKSAFQDFIKAGETGNPNGYISAGAMQHTGYGSIVPRDRRSAFDLYQKAAEMGSIDAWRNVVACHTFGHGVPKCQQTADYITKTMLKDDK